MWNLFKRKQKPSLTEIEDALFRGQNRAHLITNFVATNDYILLKLAPQINSNDKVTPDSNALIEAKFNNVHNLSRETHDDDIGYPWSIIGFDCKSISNNRWSFCLHTDWVEYTFDSDWPEIK